MYWDRNCVNLILVRGGENDAIVQRGVYDIVHCRWGGERLLGELFQEVWCIVQVGEGTRLLSTLLDSVWGLHDPYQVGPHVANLFLSLPASGVLLF